MDLRVVIFDLIDTRNFDGLIIWGNTIFQRFSIEEIRIFCNRYRPLPIVSIGSTPIDDIPEIVINNYQGMYDAVEHLIQAHGYHKIAFIQGPDGHPEAGERYQAYTDALAAYGLTLDPRLVLPGEFITSSGVTAAKIMLDERGLRPQIDFEAVVAANDEMMLSVFRIFQERGIHIPDEAAMVGFDNISETQFVMPPLTTVHQPLYENGKLAAEILFAMLAGKEVPQQTATPTKLVIRQSCGCISPTVAAAGTGAIRRINQPLEAAITAQNEKILTEMIQTVGVSETISAQASELLDNLTADLSSNLGDSLSSQSTFLPALNNALRHAVLAGEDVATWQGMMSVLIRYILPYLDNEQLLQTVGLWQQARVMIGEVALQNQSNQTLIARNQAEILREISYALRTSFDVKELVETLVRSLPQLDISSCYLSLYENPANPTQWSRLILAYANNKRIALEPEGRLFSSRQLIPEDILPPEQLYHMVIIPLTFKYQQLGFVMFAAEPYHGSIYEAVGAELSTALQGALLINQEERRAQQLQTVAEVSTTVSTVLDTTELLQHVVDLTKAHFGLYHAHIYLLNEDKDTLILAAGTGEVGAQLIAQSWSIPLAAEQSLVSKVARNQQGKIINNVEDSPYWRPNPLLPNTRSELAVPLIVGDNVLGVFDVQADRIDFFSEEDIDIQSTLAAQIAVAIQNTQLYRQEAARGQELARLNANLKATQAELLRQERLAVLGQLTATVSHEIRNPLATIRASAFSVDRITRNKGLGVERALDRIQRNITRCDGIIGELLDFTRTSDLNLQHIHFDQWLQEVLDEQSIPNNIKCTYALHAGVEVSLDPSRFQRVIINLIDNACEAMLEYAQSNTDNQPMILRVQSEIADKQLKVTITDTGPGIPPEILPQIFEPLYSTKGFGVGLGLSIVKEIVKQHKGEIKITSNNGQGTQVVLWLPLP
jgi:signal transduction histidine kinase/DNA-binding LacI/PurR family transcriptional regulator